MLYFVVKINYSYGYTLFLQNWYKICKIIDFGTKRKPYTHWYGAFFDKLIRNIYIQTFSIDFLIV